MSDARRRERVLMLLANNTYPEDPRVVAEARALSRAGYQVTVVCPRRDAQARRETVGDVEVRRYVHPPEGRHFVGYLVEYAHVTVGSLVLALQVLRERGVDIVHAHNPPDTLVLVGGLFKLLGKRFVYDHHDLAPELYLAGAHGRGSARVYRVLALLERLSGRLADRVITTNESHRELEVARWGVPEERITVVRNGPEPDRLSAVPGDRDLRARGGLIVGWVGTIGFHDGLEDLLRAVGHLVHDLGRKDAFCVVIGDGDHLADCKRLASDLGLDGHVHFTGFVPYDRVSGYLCATDVCVVPDPSNAYNDRSTMIKVMEYMALERPIVAYDLPETRVSAQAAAQYVTPNDPFGLAEAIMALGDDPERRAAMGSLGRRRVEEQLAWEHSVPHLLEAYERVSAPAREGGLTTVGTGRWQRDPGYLARRIPSILQRYGITTNQAKDRVWRCVSGLAEHGVAPTFATPGKVIERDAAFFSELAEHGVEFAVHGYHHVDFRHLSRSEIAWQFARAQEAYARLGIRCEGFRCPYLSFDPEVAAEIAGEHFTYSSNRAVTWPVVPAVADNSVFAQFAAFYRAVPASEFVAVPSLASGLVEIPVSVPDDLELWDAIGLRGDAFGDTWLAMLGYAHERGELFAPLFHPESFDLVGDAIRRLLLHARSLRPAVWMTQLRDVARWWREKARFGATVVADDEGGLRIELHCSDRATVLVRDWAGVAPVRPWVGRWSLLDARGLRCDGHPRPFVGAAGLDGATVAFLRAQGYIVEEGELAARCSVVLDARAVAGLRTEVALLDHLERTVGPLVRFSRWPDAAKSAFCFSGDLDGLSVRDYVRRLREGGERRRRAGAAPAAGGAGRRSEGPGPRSG